NNFYGAMQIFVKKNLHTSYRLMNILIKISIFYRAFISYAKRFLTAYYPVFLDAVFIAAGMIAAIFQRFEYFPLEQYSLVIIIYSLIWMITLAMSGTYNKGSRFSLIKPLNGILIGLFINSSFTYFFNEYAFSRVVVLRTTFNAYLLLFLWRLAAKIIDYAKSKSIFVSYKTLVVGKNDETERFVDKLKTRVDSEYDFIGYISINSDQQNGFIGNMNNLKDIVAANRVKNIVFAKSALTNQLILDLMWGLRNYNISFKILSGDSDIILGKSALDKIDDIYLMQIEYNINKKINIFVKRIFDILFGVICLFSVYPVIVVLTKLFRFNEQNSKFLNKLKLIPSVISGR